MQSARVNRPLGCVTEALTRHGPLRLNALEAMMRTLLSRAWKRFDSDQAGNAAVLFAFTAVPMIALLGGAVDVTRHVRYKTQIQNAMDSAAVALVRRGAKNDADADRFVNDY